MTDHETPDLDTLLSESAPATSEHGPVRTAALEAMAREASPGLSTRGRRGLRAAVVSAVGIAALGLGSAAAADSLGWDVPWLSGATAEYVYALPSGAECTVVVGEVKGQPDTVAATEAFLQREDLLDILDMDSAIAFIHEGPSTYDLGGTEVDAGPGTEYWTADLEYQSAFMHAVATALTDMLTTEGYEQSDLSYGGYLDCPGADLPDYMDAPVD